MHDMRSDTYSRPALNGVRQASSSISDYVADDQPVLAEDVTAPEAQTAEQTLEELTRLVLTTDETQSFPSLPREASNSRENEN